MKLSSVSRTQTGLSLRIERLAARLAISFDLLLQDPKHSHAGLAAAAALVKSALHASIETQWCKDLTLTLAAFYVNQLSDELFRYNLYDTCEADCGAKAPVAVLC